MTCDDVRPQLTAYLDGELEGDRGSAVRGHLRGCEACRATACDEGTLRDGLRALPPLDPPASLWAGVQRQLADAEVADSNQPSWRRALARWLPLAPRFGLAATALVLAIGVLAWRYTHTPAPALPIVAHDPQPPEPSGALDVTAELALDAARTTATYAETTDELVKLALEQRTAWPDDRKGVFDTRLTDLRHDIDVASDGRLRHKAYRALIRYLQRVTTRDEVAFADVQGAP